MMRRVAGHGPEVDEIVEREEAELREFLEGEARNLSLPRAERLRAKALLALLPMRRELIQVWCEMMDAQAEADEWANVLTGVGRAMVMTLSELAASSTAFLQAGPVDTEEAVAHCQQTANRALRVILNKVLDELTSLPMELTIYSEDQDNVTT